MLLIIFLAFLSLTVAQDSDFTCFVGYAVNGSIAAGGPLPCPGESCFRASKTYGGASFEIFACEPLNICSIISSDPGLGLTVSCCNDSDCNVDNITVPSPSPSPGYTVPNLCNTGIYVNSPNSSIALLSETPNICYGDCASFSFSSDSFNASILTCDPINLCDHMELDNSCHDLPNGIISACCCSSNLCIDPQRGILPTPPPPPPGSIKCPAGIEIIDSNGESDTISAVTTVDCMGVCHNTRYNGSGTIYDVYSCDTFGICDILDIPPEGCNNGIGSITSCCCTTNYCNINNITGLIDPDPFPPNKAERCFSGFSLSSLGGVPIGQSDYCRGYCASYTINQGFTIYGCDPVAICDTFNIHDNCNTHSNVNGNDTLMICCCSTPDCNRPIPPPSNNTCVSGVSINYGSGGKLKGENVACNGPCANFTASVGSVTVTVYTCDSLNICQLPDAGVPINVSCCNGTHCNIGDISNFQPVNTTGMQNMTCFAGIELGRQGALGFHVPCQGHCSRIHIGSDTFYTCDPADVCTDIGVDGCTILTDGLSVCCCQGERCNDKDRRIEPHVQKNLSCVVGYGIGDAVMGAYQPCDGMCGRMSASIGDKDAVAYTCLNFNLCRDLDLYEECRYLAFDQAIRSCCCGTTGCNYHGNQTIPTPVTPSDTITCPTGVWINGNPIYDGNTVTSCGGSCGSVTLGTTFHGTNTSLTYYSCDPATFCQDAQLTNGCKQITDTFGFCCCSSSMCMDPVSHKYSPSSGTPTGINCFVGYGINNSTLTGSSLPCSGKCVTATGTIGNNTLSLFACEPLSICDWAPQGTGIILSCCDNSDNCNTNGYTTPAPPTNNTLAPPLVCYEGIYINGSAIQGGGQRVCDGDCAKFSALSPISNSTYDLYTCDPLSLCSSLKLDNSCTNSSTGIFSGCCCNSQNLCLDPANNITIPITPAPGSRSASTAVFSVLLLAITFLIY